MKNPTDRQKLVDRAAANLQRLTKQWRAETAAILANFDNPDDAELAAIPTVAILNTVSLEVAMLEERIELLEAYIESQGERDKGTFH